MKGTITFRHRINEQASNNEMKHCMRAKKNIDSTAMTVAVLEEAAAASLLLRRSQL